MLLSATKVSAKVIASHRNFSITSQSLTATYVCASELASQRAQRQLFDQLNLHVKAGELIHVVGPNGAGKSTLLRILAGIYRPDRGALQWFDSPDLDAAERAERLLFIGHKPAVKQELTALEQLAWWAQVAKQQIDAWALLEAIGLLALEDVPAQQLSAGQQRRIALTRLWFTQAPLWILDEPFTALDQQGIRLLTGRFAEHVAAGGSIIMSSHQSLGMPCRTIDLGGSAA